MVIDVNTDSDCLLLCRMWSEAWFFSTSVGHFTTLSIKTYYPSTPINGGQSHCKPLIGNPLPVYQMLAQMHYPSWFEGYLLFCCNECSIIIVSGCFNKLHRNHFFINYVRSNHFQTQVLDMGFRRTLNTVPICFSACRTWLEHFWYHAS